MVHLDADPALDSVLSHERFFRDMNGGKGLKRRLPGLRPYDTTQLDARLVQPTKQTDDSETKDPGNRNHTYTIYSPHKSRVSRLYSW